MTFYIGCVLPDTNVVAFYSSSIVQTVLMVDFLTLSMVGFIGKVGNIDRVKLRLIHIPHGAILHILLDTQWTGTPRRYVPSHTTHITHLSSTKNVYSSRFSSSRPIQENPSNYNECKSSPSLDMPEPRIVDGFLFPYTFKKYGEVHDMSRRLGMQNATTAPQIERRIRRWNWRQPQRTTNVLSSWHRDTENKRCAKQTRQSINASLMARIVVIF